MLLKDEKDILLPHERELIISQYLETQKGKKALANSLIYYLKTLSKNKYYYICY